MTTLFLVVSIGFLRRYKSLLTKFNLGLLLSFLAMITARGLLYIVNFLILQDLRKEQVEQNNVCTSLKFEKKRTFMLEMVGLCDFLLF